MAAEIKHATKDVYGIKRELPLNYVTREGVDNEFIDSLGREKHVVVFGSSKQGKTSLRKKCLNEDDYIVIHCSNKWKVEDINTNILKRAGFEITQSTKKSSSGKNKIVASLKSIIFPGTTASVKAEIEQTRSIEKTTSELELDVEDVNDIINALNIIDFNKFILLEDFHYLPVEVQRDFAIALKAFHENSKFCFIIVGVWLDENRLITLNGDLTGRVISVNADKWTPHQLNEVIEAGESLLNIRFDDNFKDQLILSCFDNVHIVQETCYLACEQADVKETQDELVEVGKDINVETLTKQIVGQQSGRYNSFIINISNGFQETTLEMYKWLLYPILTSNIETLEEGLKYADIRKSIQSKHPKGGELNPGNLTQSLKFLASLQISKGIQPVILDYDETNRRLQIVDRGFLIWLSLQDKTELLELATLPTE